MRRRKSCPWIAYEISGVHPVSHWRKYSPRVRPDRAPLVRSVFASGNTLTSPCIFLERPLIDYDHATASQTDALALGRKTIAPRNPLGEAKRGYARRAGGDAERSEAAALTESARVVAAKLAPAGRDLCDVRQCSRIYTRAHAHGARCLSCSLPHHPLCSTHLRTCAPILRL